MKLYSTSDQLNRVSFVEAVQNAYPADKGLYFPEQFPVCTPKFLSELKGKSFAEMATQLSALWLDDEIPLKILEEMCWEAFDFPVPLVPIADNLFILELFQGPTMAFKDFGARFMAKIVHWIIKNTHNRFLILTATSGDTGGAVASAFAEIENLDVVILFPKGKVSELQRKQLTTLGANIHAIAIEGNFDDCQRLVKELLLDTQIQKEARFCSANSINIARLIPQTFYYFFGHSLLKKPVESLVFSVPSGNFGNLTAGLMAQKMGLPIDRFLAATNENDIVPNYLETGNFMAKSSLETLATAMDVGNPSNFVRLLEITGHQLRKMRELIHGYRVGDMEIIQTIRDLYQEKGYLLDPHTAIGVKGIREYAKNSIGNFQGIVLGTAHPAKFPEMIEKELQIKITLPFQLSQLNKREEKYETLKASLGLVKQYLLDQVLSKN